MDFTSLQFAWLIFLTGGLVWLVWCVYDRQPQVTEPDPDEELEEMGHDYATMATLIEELRVQLADLQQHAGEQDKRLDQQQILLSTFGGPDREELSEEEESVTPTLAHPLQGWLDGITQELDQL